MKINRNWLAMRIVLWLPVFTIMIITHGWFAIHRSFQFVAYGGEFMHLKKDEKATITGIYEMLKEQYKVREETK